MKPPTTCPVQRAIEVLESIDFERETHGAGDRSSENPPITDPRSAGYPGRMSAFPDTPDEELF